MTIVERIRDTLRGVTGWTDECEAGAPVPSADECRGTDCHSVRLTELETGVVGVVSCLIEPWRPEAAKLASLGILPGVRIRLLQRFPAYVLRVGRSELALDAELASGIRVRRETTTE